MFVDKGKDVGIHRELTAPDTPERNAPMESGLWRAIKAGHAAQLAVPSIYPDVCLAEVRGSTDAVDGVAALGVGGKRRMVLAP